MPDINKIYYTTMSNNSGSFITELLKWAAVRDSNMSSANHRMYLTWQADENAANALQREAVKNTHR